MDTTRKGTIFALWWIRCGRCDFQECLATTSKPVANEERSKRGWMRRTRYGYVCPECLTEMTENGAKRIAARATKRQQLTAQE